MKVHILKWLSPGPADGKIGGVYADYDRAVRIAEETNLERKRWRVWLDRWASGRESKWVIETFEMECDVIKIENMADLRDTIYLGLVMQNADKSSPLSLSDMTKITDMVTESIKEPQKRGKE